MPNKTNELKIGDEVYCIIDNKKFFDIKNLNFYYKMPWKAIIEEIYEYSESITTNGDQSKKGYFTIVIKGENPIFNRLEVNPFYIKDIYKTEKEALNSYLEKIRERSTILYNEYGNLYRDEIKIIQKLNEE